MEYKELTYQIAEQMNGKNELRIAEQMDQRNGKNEQYWIAEQMNEKNELKIAEQKWTKGMGRIDNTGQLNK